jgi:hypothetical protein
VRFAFFALALACGITHAWAHLLSTRKAHVRVLRVRMLLCSMIVNMIALIIVTVFGGLVFFGLERKTARGGLACAWRASAARVLRVSRPRTPSHAGLTRSCALRHPRLSTRRR